MAASGTYPSEQDLLAWDVETLAALFDGNIATAILTHRIDGSTLLLLKEDDLKEMFAGSIGDRLTLKKMQKHYDTRAQDTVSQYYNTCTESHILVAFCQPGMQPMHWIIS